jgi:hypothetical protein
MDFDDVQELYKAWIAEIREEQMRDKMRLK